MSFEECEPPTVRVVELAGGKTAMTVDLGGRVSLDYLRLYQKYEPGERASFKLSAIADIVVPELPKLKYEGSLHDLYRRDFAFFVRYNIRDTECLSAFEDRLGYVEIANLNDYQASVGAIGQYKSRLIWRRLGYARDRVFRVAFSEPTKTVLIGAVMEGGE